MKKKLSSGERREEKRNMFKRLYFVGFINGLKNRSFSYLHSDDDPVMLQPVCISNPPENKVQVIVIVIVVNHF